jgi:hypothetical protein
MNTEDCKTTDYCKRRNSFKFILVLGLLLLLLLLLQMMMHGKKLSYANAVFWQESPFFNDCSSSQLAVLVQFRETAIARRQRTSRLMFESCVTAALHKTVTAHNLHGMDLKIKSLINLAPLACKLEQQFLKGPTNFLPVNKQPQQQQ